MPVNISDWIKEFPMLAFVLFFGMLEWDLIQNYSCTWTKQVDHAEVVLTWDLQFPAQQIAIFRGKQFIESIPGDSTSYVFKEYDYGVMQYTIAWCWNLPVLNIFDYATGVLNLGRITWDAPAGEISGYYLYLLDGPDRPTQPMPHDFDTKEIDPENPHEVRIVPVKILLDKGLIVPGVVHVAASSYKDIEGGHVLVSDYAEKVVTFTFQDLTWPTLPALPFCPVQLIMEW